MNKELQKLLDNLELFGFVLALSLFETWLIHLFKDLDLIDFTFCWIVLYLINFMFINIVNINSDDLE